MIIRMNKGTAGKQTIKKRMIKKGQGLINLLYPPICPFCEKQLLEIGICSGCVGKMPFIQGCRCMKCSKPVYSEEMEYCMDCTKTKHSYEEGRALLLYNDLVQKSIARYKYKNKREFSSSYSKLMIKEMGEIWKKWDCDAVLPIPVHRQKKQKRGFNQAELLAKAIGEYLCVPCETRLLQRCINTLPQKEFSPAERRKNLENAFKMKRNSVEYKKVLLIDDIYTTGSTVDACANVLRQAGVKKVYFSSISIGAGI